MKETIVVLRLNFRDEVTILFPVTVFTSGDPKVVARAHLRAFLNERNMV